jgi:hypothetical protein
MSLQTQRGGRPVRSGFNSIQFYICKSKPIVNLKPTGFSATMRSGFNSMQLCIFKFTTKLIVIFNQTGQVLSSTQLLSIVM